MADGVGNTTELFPQVVLAPHECFRHLHKVFDLIADFLMRGGEPLKPLVRPLLGSGQPFHPHFHPLLNIHEILNPAPQFGHLALRHERLVRLVDAGGKQIGLLLRETGLEVSLDVVERGEHA